MSYANEANGREREDLGLTFPSFLAFPANTAAFEARFRPEKLLTTIINKFYVPNIGGLIATVTILCSALPVKFSVLMCPTYERQTKNDSCKHKMCKTPWSIG